MAYEIRHKAEAEYHLIQFHGPRELLERLDRTLRITDGVIRYRIIKLDPGTPDPPDLRGGSRRSRRPRPRGRAAPTRAVDAASRQTHALPRDSATKLRRFRGDPGNPPGPHVHSPTSFRSLPKGGRKWRRQNINRVILTGRLTRDPELRTLPSGMSVCSLRIAFNTRKKDQTTGEWGEKAQLRRRDVWGRQGEIVAQYLTKGRAIAIDGRLEWREWQDQRATTASRSRSSPTTPSSSAAATRARAAAAAASPRAPTSRSTPPTSPPQPVANGAPAQPVARRAGGRRHPVLGG